MHAAAGGPPVVVDRLSRELVLLGHEVQVLTTDYQSGANEFWHSSAHRPYRLEVFRTFQNLPYAYSFKFSKAIRQAVSDSDVVHVHTLWTHSSRSAMQACHHTNTPFLAMPHGMLDPFSIRRGWLKKQIYGRAFEWPLLRGAFGICFTHPEEERLARQSCPGLPQGYIIELGAESSPDTAPAILKEGFLRRFPQLINQAVVLFLGRVHAKKGLDLLIPAFARVCRELPDAHLLLVGPGETAYVESIRRQVAQLKLCDSVTITGPLYDCDKWAAMASSRLFVLPSYQENFALTVVDALRSGLPVLLSRRINIWEDLVAAGVARDCDLSIESVAREIIDCLCDCEWRSRAVVSGESLLKSRFNWASAAKQLATVYESARAVTRA